MCKADWIKRFLIVFLVLTAVVTGLIFSVTDKAEDVKDLFQKFNISENEIIFNASLRHEKNGRNNAILYQCTLDDGQEGVGIILAGLKDGVWQIALDKRHHLDSDVMYFTGEYTAGSEEYSIYAGYIASPDAVEVQAVTTDGTAFKSSVFKKVSNRSYFLLDVPSQYSHPEINILDKDGNIINSVGSDPKHEPSAANKSDLGGIAYNGSNIYVAVGSMGKILTSNDGIKWTERQPGIDKTLRGVVWGGE